MLEGVAESCSVLDFALLAVTASGTEVWPDASGSDVANVVMAKIQKLIFNRPGHFPMAANVVGAAFVACPRRGILFHAA
ncbi:MAG: hypothetical protein NTY19_08820 [Planctomycetota bacterium]|nr:hypothetical protein [Planctomycetota bacterium]